MAWQRYALEDVDDAGLDLYKVCHVLSVYISLLNSN